MRYVFPLFAVAIFLAIHLVYYGGSFGDEKLLSSLEDSLEIVDFEIGLISNSTEDNLFLVDVRAELLCAASAQHRVYDAAKLTSLLPRLVEAALPLMCLKNCSKASDAIGSWLLRAEPFDEPSSHCLVSIPQ